MTTLCDAWNIFYKRCKQQKKSILCLTSNTYFWNDLTQILSIVAFGGLETSNIFLEILKAKLSFL